MAMTRCMAARHVPSPAPPAASTRGLVLSPPVQHVFGQQLFRRQSHVFVSIQGGFERVLQVQRAVRIGTAVYLDRAQHLAAPLVDRVALPRQAFAQPIPQTGVIAVPEFRDGAHRLGLYRVIRTAKPLGVATRRPVYEQWRWRAMLSDQVGEPPFDRPRVLDPIGFDEEAAVEVEECEVARMKRTQPRERIARESELEDVFVTASRYVDERTRATWNAWRRIARLDAAHLSPDGISSRRRYAAHDRQHDAGHVARAYRRGQKHIGWRDLFRLRGPLHARMRSE